ncbi:MAG: hypothetical protein K6G25_06365 [Bacteroidales bacterium]|nr:hypothetical protein [Bacteroidales bacterium]
MEAKELMIGDWVYQAQFVDAIKPYTGHGWLPVKVPSVPFDEDYFIEPIPLTPEILEKNGFKKNGIPNSIASIKEMDWCDDTYVWSRQETPDERMFVSVYMDDPYNFFVEVICQYCHVDGIHVKYVHELQHALKLCKIEKEIQL